MTILSICIPTYNRAVHLRNCLSSLIQCGLSNLSGVQICISDNCSTDTTKQVVEEASKVLTIKYKVNQSNIGSARNFLEVVQMADGEFVWMLGDDDLLMPGACEKIIELIKKHSLVDYFFVNSSHLTNEYVQSFSQPFELKNLPKAMERFSPRAESGELRFLELIDPKISFDFLAGIFLSVFRRSMWLSHVDCLDKHAVADIRVASHFENTFAHVKIFANAFSNSKAYFHAEPLSICLTGAREWAPMYPFIRSVRLIQALDEYRKNGLAFNTYWRCKNFALRTFIPDIVFTLIYRKESGYEYLNLSKLLYKNWLYPELYLSPFRYILRKVVKLFHRM
ncbi:glycosyltransferase family 2 protein [bacterium]|nr:glycosyltransferase family 2 protein [bacterium]